MKSLQWVIVATVLLFFYSCKCGGNKSVSDGNESFSGIVQSNPSRVAELLRTADSIYRTDSIKFPQLADSTIKRLLVKHNEPIVIADSFPPNIMIATHDLLNIIFQKGDSSNPRTDADSLIFQLAVYRDTLDVIRYNNTLHQHVTLNGDNGIRERPTLLIRLQTSGDPARAVAPGRLCPPPRGCEPN